MISELGTLVVTWRERERERTRRRTLLSTGEKEKQPGILTIKEWKKVVGGQGR